MQVNPFFHLLDVFREEANPPKKTLQVIHFGCLVGPRHHLW